MNEFRGQWRFVIAPFLGLLVCMPAVLLFSMGALLPILHETFGWSRAEISFAYTIANLTLFSGSAVAGHAADRYGTRAVATASIVAFATALLLLPFFIGSILSFYIGYLLASLLGLGGISAVLLRPIFEQFGRQRGIALGLAMSGTGLAGVLMPQYVTFCADIGGWRGAYIGLAAITFLVAPVIWIALRPNRRGRSSALGAVSQEGLLFSEARQTRQFWILSAISVTAGAGTAGLLVHLISFIKDMGGTTVFAAFIASVLGISSMIGRVAAGYGLDKTRGPSIGVALFAIAALGICLLRFSGIEFALIAMVLFGLVIGAEMDLLAYFSSRYFGSRSTGAIYGWMYGLISLGGSFSPFVFGSLRDHYGNYRHALDLNVGLLLLIAVLMRALGPYRYAAHPNLN